MNINKEVARVSNPLGMCKSFNETDLKTWTTIKLKKRAMSLYSAIYHTECFSSHDVNDFMAIESELESRGYEFKESKTLSIVKN